MTDFAAAFIRLRAFISFGFVKLCALEKLTSTEAKLWSYP